MNWADCVAAIQAGARPADIIGGAAFEAADWATETSQEDLTSASHKHEIGAVPKRLSHRLTEPGSSSYRDFRLLFLRTPQDLWDAVEETSHRQRPKDVSISWDSELEFPLLSLFQPRFIGPPCWLSVSGSGDHHEPEAEFYSAGNLDHALRSGNGFRHDVVTEAGGDTSKQEHACARHPTRPLDLERQEVQELTDALVQGMASERIHESVLTRAKILSAADWAAMFPRIADRVDLHPGAVLSLCQQVRSVDFAEFLCTTVIPSMYTSCDEGDETLKELHKLALDCRSSEHKSLRKLRSDLDGRASPTADPPQLAMFQMQNCLFACSVPRRE